MILQFESHIFLKKNILKSNMVLKIKQSSNVQNVFPVTTVRVGIRTFRKMASTIHPDNSFLRV